jgi:hypothetical protein
LLLGMHCGSKRGRQTMMIFGTNNRLQSPVSFLASVWRHGDLPVVSSHLRLDVLFKVVMPLILHQFKSL